MLDSPLASLHRMVWLALLAALIAVGAFMYVPLGPVSMTLQVYFVLLAGLIMGPVYGPLAVLLYVLAGAAGLPVFSGGRSGFAHLMGPTGGFLAGFVVAAYICGLVGGGRKTPLPILCCGVCVAIGVVYLVGVWRLAAVLDMEMQGAFALGLMPLAVGDLFKVLAAVLSYRFLFFRRLLPR